MQRVTFVLMALLLTLVLGSSVPVAALPQRPLPITSREGAGAVEFYWGLIDQGAKLTVPVDYWFERMEKVGVSYDGRFFEGVDNVVIGIPAGEAFTFENPYGSSEVGTYIVGANERYMFTVGGLEYCPAEYFLNDLDRRICDLVVEWDFPDAP